MISAVVVTIAGICLLASFLPLVPIAHGFFRSFDFCRLQVITLSAATLVAALIDLYIVWPPTILAMTAVGMAIAALVIQTIHVLPFTPVMKKQTMHFRGDPEKTPTLSILTSNVKQANTDYSAVTDLIAEKKPDIAVFMETDEGWAKALRPALSDFREIVDYPQDNTYGIIFASRLPVKTHKIEFLLNKEVPSVFVTVTLPEGRDVRVVALHPEPPLPVRDTVGRDAEILLVAEVARDEDGPMIVTGDLNDVAWSRTTRRFLRISRLLDPRQGRGLYNSFDARYWFLRWPLDHIFHSRHFQLIEIERQPFVGSDHFPMYYRFALSGGERNGHPPDATEADIEETEELVAEEKSRDRPPVGTDWE
ncbi:hypothetical protein FMN50_07745 [Rhodobacterales bacterium]|nr:hypothetical protein FMN50_07745 [Rhodobacterales bacterium]